MAISSFGMAAAAAAEKEESRRAEERRERERITVTKTVTALRAIVETNGLIFSSQREIICWFFYRWGRNTLSRSPRAAVSGNLVTLNELKDATSHDQVLSREVRFAIKFSF